MKSRLLRIFRVLVPVIGVVFAISVMHNQLLDIDFGSLSVNLKALFFATFILLGIYFLDALGWYLINDKLGVKATRSETLIIWLRSSVARYVPGVIWGYADRVLFLKSKGVDNKIVAVSFTSEMALLFLSSFSVGGVIIFFSEFSWLVKLIAIPQRLMIIGGAVIVISVAATLIILKYYKLEFLRNVASYILSCFPLYLYYLVLWLLFIISFSLLFFALLSGSYDYLIFVKAGVCFSLAFSLSFVLIIFPSGIGVREVILFALLISLVSSADAAFLAVASRIWLMSGELISLLLCGVFALVSSKR